MRPCYHLILTIDPNVTTLYSTSSGRAVHAPLQATARHSTDLCTADVLSARSVYEKCAHHTHINSDTSRKLSKAAAGWSQLAQRNVVKHSVVVDGILMVEQFVVRCWEFLQPRRGTQCGKSAPVLFSALRSQSTSADVLAQKGTVHRSSDLLLRVGRVISLCQM